MILIDDYPRETGAGDMADSCRLNAMMAFVDHELTINPLKYYVNGQPVRCPLKTGEPRKTYDPLMFSKDQMMGLVYMLKKYGLRIHANSEYRLAQHRLYRAPNILNDDGSAKWLGGDLFSPSNMNTFRICADIEGFKFGYKWMEWDIEYNAWSLEKYYKSKKRMEDPDDHPVEQNQLILQCDSAGPYWVKKYLDSTKYFDQAIYHYWSGWRGEKDLGGRVVDTLILKGDA